MVQAAVMRRMTPQLMVAPVRRNQVPALADQLLLLTVILGMEAQVPQEPVVLAARLQASPQRPAAGAAADITAGAAVALPFKP